MKIWTKNCMSAVCVWFVCIHWNPADEYEESYDAVVYITQDK